MSIYFRGLRDDGAHRDAQCDGVKCDEWEYGVSGSFAQTIAKLKNVGWAIEKDRGGDWVHYCPACAKARSQAKAAAAAQR